MAEKPNDFEDKVDEVKPLDSSPRDQTRRRVPPLDLQRARDFEPDPSEKPPSDSELLIASELPHIRRPQHDSTSGQEGGKQVVMDEEVERVLEGLDSWSFDIFKIDDENLPKMVERIFYRLGLFDSFPLDIRKVRTFIQAMVERYQPNPYHNFRHACDVLHAVYLLLTLVNARSRLTHLEVLALALAALCHDVDHPGLTNQFLIATYDTLAIRYNDRAVLESHHAATCFLTLRSNDSVNLLSGLSEEEQRHMRKLMIILVLATDMGEHARILDAAAQRLRDVRPFEPSPLYTPPGSLSPIITREESAAASTEPTEGDGQKQRPVKVYKNPLSPSPPIQSTSDATLVLQLIIKCADISNVVKPFVLSKRWAALLLLEWFRQGVIEKQLGLPISKFMDREDPTTLMAMTCGCIDFIAKPMYELTAKFLPKISDDLIPNLMCNRQLWNNFTTNGRRASETAQDILGPYAPPRIPRSESLQNPPIRLETKLVATFSGQYFTPDSPTGRQTTFSEKSTVCASGTSVTDSCSLPSLSRLGSAEPSESQLSPASSGRDGVLSPSTSGRDNQPSPHSVETLRTQEQEQSTGQAESRTEILDLTSKSSELGPEKPREEGVKDRQEEVPQMPEPQEQNDVLSLGDKVDAENAEKAAVGVAISHDGSESEPVRISFSLTDPTTSQAPSEPSSAQAPVNTLDSEANPTAESLDTTTVAEPDLPAPSSVKEGLEQRYEAPLSLLFGAPTTEDLLIPAKVGKDKNVSLVSALLPSANRLITDRSKASLEQMAFRAPTFQPDMRGSFSSSFSNGEIDLEKSSSTGKTTPVGFREALRTHPRVARLNRAVESRSWNILLIVATLVALFIDDVAKGFLPKKADMYEAHILTACLVLFLAEAGLLCIFRDRYFFSSFFWLDLLGSLSLLPYIIGLASQNLVIARTGRAAETVTGISKTLQASRIQQQVGNFLPILRPLRVLGFCKDSSLSNPEVEDEEKVSTRPSQLWTRLSELTTQKLILGLLALIIVTPYLRNNSKDLAPLVSLNILDDYLIASDKFNQSLARLLNTTQKHGYSLEYLAVKEGCRSYQEGGFASCRGIDVPTKQPYIQILPVEGDGRQIAQQKYRTSELVIVTSDSSRAQAFFSNRGLSKLKYGMNIASTVIILVILAAWCFFLGRDSNRLLIQPIERMVDFVKELAEDPVSFAGKTVVKPSGDERQVMETFYVESSLVKIASLTKVALGDAGMGILSVNLKGSEFNPMLPGKKIRACFGFCDIRNFTDATECLQEDVMMFVNRIADVVHNKVMLHSGFPNKNIGDAFLIVWKKTVSDNTNKSRATSFADRALRAFLDIIQSIETSQSLAEFAKHPAIQKRMPGYRIHMGFGLHVGWAIEGAIGSAHKVDPSYLSPHVNMASRLEAATKQYGVMLLISETVIDHLTKSSLRDNCRKLDRVTVKGSQDPMVLYTFDIPLFQQDLRGDPQEYRDLFEYAVDAYIDGDWDVAFEKLQECQALWPTDKPITVLLNYMTSHKNQAPETWAGFRELTEK